MPARIADFSAAVKQAVGVQLASNLGDALELYRAEIEAEIGVQGPPRSSPGEAPHRDTGALQESFFTDLDGDTLEGLVGSDSDYAAPLEISMRRPIFLPVLMREADAIGRIICKP